MPRPMTLYRSPSTSVTVWRNKPCVGCGKDVLASRRFEGVDEATVKGEAAAWQSEPGRCLPCLRAAFR